ncbi:golgin subfamily A member 4 isoform X2 [Hoplias malabaricus]|uniref:golgin subfamily A member 4 isoform X2 n=1 Tax=Hoplias malabaricus TaxID=27720 RepID=UPI0034636488
MFKKLKQRINEEQSPQRSVNQSPQQQQAQVSSGERRGQPPGLHQDAPSTASDRENIKAVGGSTRGSVNGDGAASPLREEAQSLAQKLQQRVSSVESLFRVSGRAEGLFRSGSRESLVRSSSRDSLTQLADSEVTPSYDPPSDIESEAEDSPGSAEALSKEQLIHRLHRLEKSVANYRGKYSELVTAYRSVQRDKEKTQVILSQSQDKALRRIGELREELQMDQQAKKHLQEEFDAALEEKDQMITVLQTQVALMKKRLNGVPGALGEAQSTDGTEINTNPQNSAQGDGTELNEAGDSSEPGNTVDMEGLQKRVLRQETLLQRCKELIRTNKERSTQLSSENEALQQQLQERLQELEKMKELHTTEKTKLITQLRDAKNLIEQLEQDKGMVIAETKRQMHETLEMKEEEIAQLRSRIQQAVAQKEEIQEQKEKTEKAAFEELERALGVAQRAEEARRQLQAQMEEQVKQVERASEEERKSLQQELSRVKQEVVTIMKKSSEDRIAEMEQLHSEALASKDKEIRSHINQAVCREELLQAAQEKEQQASLALEEAELQKAALQAEGEAKAKDLMLELESARTRILELESSLVTYTKEDCTHSDQLSAEIEEEKKFKAEIAALEQKHQQELESMKSELTAVLNQQHSTAVEELMQKNKTEIEAILKEKESEFHAHVEDINQKTQEKLDVKQTEIDTLTLELHELQSIKQQLEEKLLAIEADNSSARQEFEVKLKEEHLTHQAEAEALIHHCEELGGVENNLKEDLNQLRLMLEEKNKELEGHVLREKGLEQYARKAQGDAEAHLKEMEQLRHSAQCEKDSLVEARTCLNILTEELEQSKNQLKELEKLLEASHNDCQQKADCLHQKNAENEDLQQKLQKATNDLSEKEMLHEETCKAMQEELNNLKTQLKQERCSYQTRMDHLKIEMDGKLKSQETKMEKIKHKTKEMQEKFKKKLHDQEEKAKAELAQKVEELLQKDEQVKEKIREMSQASYDSLSSALSDLETNHKMQLNKLQEAQKHEQEILQSVWQERLCQQEEEMQEKHTFTLQEKVQEVDCLSQQLLCSIEEKTQVEQEVNNLREELAMRETTVQKLQAELMEAAVKLENLSEGEDMLKKQVETIEKNLNQALNEKNLFQDQLSKAEEMSKERLQALSEELEDERKKLKVLEASRCKEGEDMQMAFEEKAAELQTREKSFQSQIYAISKKLEQQCQGAQALLNGFSDDLCRKVEAKVNDLQNRVIHNQKQVSHLKNLILAKNDKINNLEKELLQAIKESQNMQSSLDRAVLQLNVNSENLKALQVEKESLQKDATNYSQVLSEKVVCIEKLDEENKNISDKVEANILHISNLEGIIDDLKTQLARSITEKEEAISLLNQQHNEEKQSLKCQMEAALEKAEKEKSLALEQVDTLRNRISELKKKVESKITQNQSMVKSLQGKIEDLERQVAERDEQLQSLTASIDNQSISKSEMDQVLSEKEQKVSALTLELDDCTKRISELEELLEIQTKEKEQLAAELQQHKSMWESQKSELILQLHQAQEQCSERNDLSQKTEEKLHSLEKEFHNTKQQLEIQQGGFDREKAVILKAKDEALKAAEESAGKAAELKKKAEQKIGLIRKQLTSQIEEKEQVVKNLQVQLEDIRQRLSDREKQMISLEENGKIMREAMNNLKDEHTKHLEEVRQDKEIQRENSLQILKDMYEEKLATFHKELSFKDELAAKGKDREEEAHSRLRELQTRLTDSEEQTTIQQSEIKRLHEELLKQTALVQELQSTCFTLQGQIKEKVINVLQGEECSVVQTKTFVEMELLRTLATEENDVNLKPEEWNTVKDLLVKEYELKLQELCRKLEEKEDQLEAQKKIQKGLDEAAVDSPTDGSKGSENDLQRKLNETELEKQKIQRDYAQLQKDLRSLRKEHETELEYLKKEIQEENDKNLKLEMEDMEIKQNSALKQLMREFNTQMALKERELDTSIKETVEKAQSVEAQLMDSHREEVSRLQKMISQKEEDLNRTVQRYEQVIQNREEEMGSRVWEVQKELEELQQRSLSGPQGIEELQVQLAEKTTLLSEAKLKEQEYQDRIHTLEDKIQSGYKNSVVTHLGSTYRETSHYSADPLSEHTEFEYLKKVMFEYMMGRETKTMAKVITSMLKFPPDQAQKVLEREDSRMMPWLR